MKKKANFRARVMKYAYQIWLNTKETWSVCMKKAWNLYRLAKLMRSGIVAFSYLKADGTIRNAYGTLMNLPDGITLGGKKRTKPSYKTLSYFDVEKNAFRCFKIENLMSRF